MFLRSTFYLERKKKATNAVIPLLFMAASCENKNLLFLLQRETSFSFD